MKEASAMNQGIATYLRRQLEAAGIQVLSNETTPLVANGDTLWIAGIGS